MSLPTNSAPSCPNQRFISFRAASCSAVAVLMVVCVLLAYQPSAAARAVSLEPKPEHLIAVVAVPMIVNELLRSDRYVPERERLQGQHRERIEEVQSQLAAIARRYEGQNPNPEDPAVREDQRRYQQLAQQLTAVQRESSIEFEKLMAKQLLDAFDLVRSAAQAVADDLGYDYVISSVGDEEEMAATSMSAAMQHLTVRPMLHFPEKADITPEVRAELRL